MTTTVELDPRLELLLASVPELAKVAIEAFIAAMPGAYQPVGDYLNKGVEQAAKVLRAKVADIIHPPVEVEATGDGDAPVTKISG